MGGAFLTALGAWLVKARQLSGKIRTSEADELWAESRAMREEYRDRLHQIEQRNRDLEDRIERCEDANRLLDAGNRELRDLNAELENLLEEERAK
jgi:predicted RNase H-like nuclease (RuvC/YqgF family)